MHNTNSDSLKSCPCFRVLRLNFAAGFFNSLLVRFHQAEILVVKHLIQRRNNEALVELNHEPCDHARRKTTLRTTRPRCRRMNDILFQCNHPLIHH